jgi:biopolymer transport protein ExbD
MRLKKKTPADVYMQLTSLIDIIFLLLIFFMCATELNKLENESITLPLAYNAKEDVGPELKARITVTISDPRKSGQWELHVQGQVFDLKQVEDLIAKSAAATGKDDKGVSEMPVKIRADCDCPYKYVNKVMDICGRSGVYKVSFGVSPREGGKSVQRSGVGSAVTRALQSSQ